ncbi:Protein dachsous, partial [Schistosoma japonicum]
MFNQMILTIISLYIIFILIVRGVPDAPLRVDIIEESPTGSIVPGVAEYLQQLISREQIKGLTQTTTTFQLMNDGIFSNLFNLDSNTGRLIISGRIDREVLCPPWDNTGGTRPISISGSISSNILTTQRNSNLINGDDFSNSSPNDCMQALNILIITRPNQQSQYLTPGTIDKHVDSSVKTLRILVHVVIHDINDNAPRWHDISILHVNFVETPSLPSNNGWNNVQTILRPINENDAIRNAKSIDRAYDPDLGSNGSIVYRLIGPGSDYFRLGDNFNRNTNNDNIDAYHIQANSESLIHRKTDLTMDLFNTNINNNNNLNLITSTHETALQIWPILPLDRETKDFAGQGGIYNLTLLASDLGIPPKSTSIPLIITLIDVNDHIPQFHNPINQYEVNNHFNTNNNNNLESNYVIYRPLNGNLRETIPIGSFVLQLNASDQDDGLHSKLIYGFCPCDRNLAQNYFKVDSITGRITVSHSLDYDNGPRQFRFKVIAKDSAPEPYTLTGTAIVEIILSDENDETPQINVMLLQPNSVHDTIPLIQHSFLSNKMKPNPDGAKLLREFTTTINENPQPETVIAYVQNKQDYRLITGTRLTDLSSSYSRLDREITPTQTITLTCTDSVGNSAYVLINVHLSDLNDNSPEFVNNGHFVFQIPENQELPDNKPIWLGRTIAVDNDQGVNALITYRLENSDHILNEYGNTDSDTITHSVNNIIDMFELNPQTGDLYVKVVFDRETAPNDGMYRLKVLCVDNGEPSLTGTAQVEIFILDENDWPPQFTREVYTFSVPENIRIHEIVGEVEAIDRDADSKGKITYQLVSHSYQPVNELSDWMSLSSNQHNSRRLHLRTPDSEFNVNEKISSLEVENTELNNTFDKKVEKTTLSNSTNELSRNRMKSLKYINYSHSEKPPTLLNYFAVDRLTGKIRLIRALDRESVAFFTIEIVAVDSAPISPITSLRQINMHKSLSSTATVVIAVTDINDNSPIFRRPNTSTAIQLSLHETLGRQLLTMEATDADEGENARITYQIKSEVPRPPGGSGTGHFAIDESSGMLFIARPLNNTTTHRFVVEACDGGAGSTKRCTLSPSIRINVYDGLHEPITNSNGELLVYQSGTGINNDNYHQNHRQSDLSFDLDDLTVGSVMAAQNGRRNEIVVVCLVVIFSILLMATILLVICLIHRRGLSVRHWVVNRTENLSTDKQDCKKDLNIMNKAVNNRSNIDLWMEN